MKSLDEPPYLSVGTDVSAKYRGAFCEAKIKSTKRLVKVKATFRQDSSTVEVPDDHVKGPLKVGAVVEVRNPDGIYQEAVISKLTDASWYTVVFDDGDEKTLRRSSLCLKGERHFAQSETLDQLPLTNPEHFGTPVIGKKTNRGRRSNQIHEEESSSSSSAEDENECETSDELIGTVVCVDVGDKKKATWVPTLVVSPDCCDDITVKKDFVLVRSFKDGKFASVPRKEIRNINEISTKHDIFKQALDHALEFCKSKTIPANWITEVKEGSSSSETEDDEEENKDDDDNDSTNEAEEEVEPFPGEREIFIQQLYKFMEDRGTPINKRPVLGYRNLNLFKLFRLVHKLGGFNNIDSGAIWKQVYQDLGIPILNSAAGYNVKCAYRKYLYGFEEYCTSASISFHMELPTKVAQKICKECVHENKVSVKQESESQGETFKEEFDAKHETINKEVNLNEVKDSTVKEIIGTSLCNESKVKEVEEHIAVNQETILEEFTPKIEETKITDKQENAEAEIKTEEEIDENQNMEIENEDSAEGEEFESYPSGMKVQVRYGRGKNQKLYEASVKDSDVEGGEVLYLVHYCGWNVRYDEWIKADKIVRPADKSVPKIKHRKKIKNKLEHNKDKPERGECSPKHCRLFPRPLFQPRDLENESTLDDPENKHSIQGPPTMVEITSILNGLQAAENSAEDSETDHSSLNMDKEGKEFDMNHIGFDINQRLDDNKSFPRAEGNYTADDPIMEVIPRSPVKTIEGSSDDTDYEVKSVRQSKFIKNDIAKSQDKRGKRKYTEIGKARSHIGNEEYFKCNKTIGRLDAGSMTSSDDEEKSNPKHALSNKYNGFDDKRKSMRTGFYTSFSESPEKRIKLLNNSEERLRAKDRKDVWSSIQGQWPKKTLKELFSDSDTEGATSPSARNLDDTSSVQQSHENIRMSSSEVSKPEKDNGLKPVDERTAEMGDKKIDFPSSGSNSVLNTPPTTPESLSTLSDCQKQPSKSDILDSLEPNQEEVQSMKSETDSTIEVDSVTCELQDLQYEGRFSPTGFDASISSNSSNQQEPENKAKSHTNLAANQAVNVGDNNTKKLKRSHKSSVLQKKRKTTTNTSDSEDLSGGESLTKMQSERSNVGLKSQPTKVPLRVHSPGKYAKTREKDLFQKDYADRLPKVYKWSFQMYLEKMTSMERIVFLQEKLQELRKHYLSLKSEVASIDRRRKRCKKKERESAVVSSSSSSPSSSSITAAVMLTLAEPTLSSSSQNAMPVECR
ncbi:AT-rich interactive domain-containing protein 4B isoform X2 [Xenopus laevis]|uniref:AT-rich interactive domain-containing protein 4B isoform X2 n=1 Tax=Xenopus laevis TaxID=8355 RepID=A0A8J0VBW1_XENLA|nr:AT-rich interactive domain-containing protein 4B isoform X2 [Xenopus laevis]